MNIGLNDDHLKYINRLLPNMMTVNVVVEKVQQQQQSFNCGLFAIANALSIYYRVCPCNIKYDEPMMRNHLEKILKNKCLEMFPTSNHDTRHLHDMVIKNRNQLRLQHKDVQNIISFDMKTYHQKYKELLNNRNVVPEIYDLTNDENYNSNHINTMEYPMLKPCSVVITPLKNIKKINCDSTNKSNAILEQSHKSLKNGNNMTNTTVSNIVSTDTEFTKIQRKRKNNMSSTKKFNNKESKNDCYLNDNSNESSITSKTYIKSTPRVARHRNKWTTAQKLEYNEMQKKQWREKSAETKLKKAERKRELRKIMTAESKSKAVNNRRERRKNASMILKNKKTEQEMNNELLCINRKRKGEPINLQEINKGLIANSIFDEKTIELNYIGKLDNECEFCKAKHFKGEISYDKKYNHCCHKNKVILDDNTLYPQELLAELSPLTINNYNIKH